MGLQERTYGMHQTASEKNVTNNEEIVIIRFGTLDRSFFSGKISLVRARGGAMPVERGKRK